MKIEKPAFVLFSGSALVALMLLSGCATEVMGDRDSVPPAEADYQQPGEKIADGSTQTAAPVAKKSAPARKTASNAGVPAGSMSSVSEFPPLPDMPKKPISGGKKSSGKSSGHASSVNSSGTYIVVSGDTLGHIAIRHGVTISQLTQANNLSVSSPLHIGQKLTIPAGGKKAANSGSAGSSSDNGGAVNSNPGLYTVKSGDSVDRIAKRLKVKRADLMAANNITENTILRIGQKLVVPGSSAAASSSDSGSTSFSGSTAISNDNQSEIDRIANELNANNGAAPSSSVKTPDAPVEVKSQVNIDDQLPLVEISEDIAIETFAKKYQTTADAIRKANGIADSETTIKAGTAIFLP